MKTRLQNLFKFKKTQLPKLSSFDEFPFYQEDNLGIQYSPTRTTFRLWSPGAERIKVSIYTAGNGENLREKHLMKYSGNGVWILKLSGDYKAKYYTFNVFYRGNYLGETPGIYAKAAGVNGRRGMILNMSDNNPPNWKSHKRPELKEFNDIVLYEVHVRDYTIHISAGSNFSGKYLGLSETGTKNYEGLSTGIDHMKELGITHVHLLPVFDFDTIDESQLRQPQFNWGYDPDNYNVPEGSYSSDPFHAEIRIKEFKQMVMQFHQNGIRVIMDVVYNHTSLTAGSNFNLEVPGYYYRQNPDGTYSNASGCGNETASERPMMRKFIIDSCKFWAMEYKIDGFRFDLMGIHDVETLNILSSELKKIDPTIFLYGEGWTADQSPLHKSLRAIKENTSKLNDIACFNDEFRDAIKGNVFEPESRGFISGGVGLEESIKFGVVGSTAHPQINYKAVYSSHKPWAITPLQSIGYVSCHDNHTLFDKLVYSVKDKPVETIKRMHKLANAIILTSQGIPFLQSGVEFLRTKFGEHNSYNLPDSVNQIDWNFKTTNNDIFVYHRDLISLRLAHPALRMSETEMIVNHLEFFNLKHTNGRVAYIIKNHANGDLWRDIIVIYNSIDGDLNFHLPIGKWTIAAKGSWIIPQGIEDISDNVIVPPISMMMLFRVYNK